MGARLVRFCAVASFASLAAACATDTPAKSGTGGTGGGLGTGGAAVVGCGSDNPDDLIADFTVDNGDHPADGRSGGWYVYGDPTPAAAFDPPKNADPTVAYPIDLTTGNSTCSGNGSFHVKATGFSTWGAAFATDFVAKVTRSNGTMFKGTYDGSKYKGISFWAKAQSPVKFVQVKFLDVFSAAEADPSTIDPSYFACTDGLCGFNNNCSPYIVKLSAPSEDPNYPKYVTTQIDTTWKRFDILFADTKPDKDCTGSDPIKMLDVKHLVSFAIQVNADFSVTPLNPTPNNFEIWLDDVRFIR